MRRGPRFFLDRLFRRARLDREMDDELRAHVELRTADLQRTGISGDLARLQARIEFGGTENYKEQCRETRRFHLLHDFLADLRYGLRMLRRTPGFTWAAVLTLALGIGANTAIFSVVSGVLLRPLPYPDPGSLIYIGEQADESKFWGDTGTYAAWREQNHSLSDIAAYFEESGNLTGHGEAQRVTYGKSTPSFFPLLNVSPCIGRNFLPEEDRPGGPAVAILSHALWQQRFHGDTSVLGQSVAVDGNTYTIIGVLPADFQVAGEWKQDEQLWVPFAAIINNRRYSGGTAAHVIGRLRPGVSLQQAKADLDSILLTTLTPRQKARSRWQATVTPWQEQVASRAKLALLTFMVAVGFVLLIACVNVANLALARAAARQQEIAVRRALGAGKWRIMRQLLTESVLLSLIGAILGFTLAFWGKNLLVAFLALELPSVPPITIDHRVLGFTVALALVTGIACGLAPALHAADARLQDSLKEAGRSSTGGRRRHYLRSALVISEITLATVLLLGAGLLLKSFVRLRGVEPGFRRDNVLLASVNLSGPKYEKPADQVRYFEQLRERVRALPGIESVGLTASPPLDLSYIMTATGLSIDGQPELDFHYSYTTADPEYFRTLGIALLRGRLFTDADTVGATNVAVVNQKFARQFFPNQDPLGRRVQTPFAPKDWLAIVGVVADVHQQGLNEEIPPVIYRPVMQAPEPIVTLLVRTAADPLKLVGAVRGQIASVDRDQPSYNILTVTDGIDGSLKSPRTHMLLLGAFAALALTLASVGIYGVVAYGVEERKHEIGIRIALGATRVHILQTIVGRGLLLAAGAVALGLIAAFAMTRLIASMLFGITATDLATFATAPLLMLVVVLVANYVPSRRATRLDPMVALRCE